jgi:hypothetical protein
MTSSRDRCTLPARELFRPSAREVFQAQDVLALMPSVIERESDTPADALVSRLADPVKSANGANDSCLLRPRPRSELAHDSGFWTGSTL